MDRGKHQDAQAERKRVSGEVPDGRRKGDSGALKTTGTGLTRSRLPPGEVEVLSRVAAGLKREEIAAELNVARRTVDGHLASVFRKLGAPISAEAVEKARELHLLPDDIPPVRILNTSPRTIEEDVDHILRRLVPASGGAG